MPMEYLEINDYLLALDADGVMRCGLLFSGAVVETGDGSNATCTCALPEVDGVTLTEFASVGTGVVKSSREVFVGIVFFEVETRAAPASAGVGTLLNWLVLDCFEINYYSPTLE